MDTVKRIRDRVFRSSGVINENRSRRHEELSIELEQRMENQASDGATGSGMELSSEAGLGLSELPPVDRGRKAWGYLFGAFLLEGLCWGFIFSFGIFQNYLNSQDRFNGNRHISTIGTAASGVGYLLCPAGARVTSHHRKYRKAVTYAGLAMCVISCFAASFCTEIWQLILTQGALYGAGTAFLYMPTNLLVNEWFVQRRGVACGVMFGGAGVFGVVLPLMFDKLINSVGYANSLRIWAVILLVLVTPTIHFLLEARLPLSQVTLSRRIDFSVFKTPFFLFSALSNTIQSLGYFVPGIYLPSFASDLNMTAIESTVVLSALNAATVAGQILIGYMGDRMGSSKPALMSSAVAAISVYLLWGISKTFATLMLFSMVYGLSAGGFSVLWTTVSGEMTDDPISQSTIVGLFAFQRGIGNIVAGPISASLITSMPSRLAYAISKYEGMVIFTGIAMIVSAGGALGTFFTRKKHSTSSLI